jgi:hypothetical protein
MKLLDKIRACATVLALVAACGLSAYAQGKGFNKDVNILIADQFNNRVIEVDPNTHEVIWQFGDGSSVAGPHSVVGTNDAQRVGPLTLIAGTGAPAGSEPTCPNGCPDNRVMLVNPAGHIVWQYGQAGVTGSGPDQLNTPVQNTWLPSGHVLITDQVNERVIEVTRDKKIVWQYGQTGVSGDGFDQLNNPNSAELLDNGHILIADENNNRVIEVDRQFNIVWSYGCATCTQLSGAAFASRLPNGNTLITDSNNNRILEVDSAGNVVFTYYTNTRPGSVSNPLPTRAVRLKNGNTLISDQFNMQVIEIDPNQNIVFTQGTIGVPGNGFDLLNAPYDAKVVGDYTGLTPPHRGNGH